MPELRQYVPQKVVGSWVTPLGAINILDGVIDGEFFSLAMDNPRWTREHDGAGNGTRVRNSNRGGSFPITLSASSPTNQLLSEAVQADDVSENMVGDILLRDLNGNTVIAASGCFLEDMAPPSFSNERGTRVWTFQCNAIEVFVGGHDAA